MGRRQLGHLQDSFPNRILFERTGVEAFSDGVDVSQFLSLVPTFDDGPRPTGLRFCVNSESISFTPSTKLATLADPAAEKATK